MPTDPPRVRLRLPDGSICEAGAEAIVGRSSLAQVRIDDPRISTVHAEISHRADGFVALARGGRVVVAGRGVREVVLEPGQLLTLAPGVDLHVVHVDGGAGAVVPVTAGRDRLRFVVGPDDVKVHAIGLSEPVVLVGVPARLLALLLERRGAGVPWDVVAELVWPEEGAIRARTRASKGRRPDDWTPTDERRLRNRWDQQLAVLRRTLGSIRDGQLVRVRQGVVEVVLGPADEVDGP